MEVSGKRLDEDIVSKLCEPCQEENVSTEAEGYCNDCEEYMCQSCFRSHLKMKLGRNHVLGAITGDKGQGKHKQEETCKKHTREVIKYYCRNHDSVGCGDCIVSDHGACKPEFIRDLAKKFEESSEFKALLRQIQKWEADKAESEARIESNRKDNRTNFDNAIREIKKFRREINIWLDKMEKSIEAEVKKISDGNEMRMSDLEKKINKVSDEIVNIKRELDTHVYQADKLFIRTVECKPRIRVVENSLSEIKSDDRFKRYSFGQETKVKELLTSTVKLGSIKVASAIKTENKPTTETGSIVKNVYKLPEWRTCVKFLGKTSPAGLNYQTMSDVITGRPRTNVVGIIYTAGLISSGSDPRAAGYDVGKRVYLAWNDLIKGIVTAVDPSGYVDVKLDNGVIGRLHAGAQGEYNVKLL